MKRLLDLRDQLAAHSIHTVSHSTMLLTPGVPVVRGAPHTSLSSQLKTSGRQRGKESPGPCTHLPHILPSAHNTLFVWPTGWIRHHGEQPRDVLRLPDRQLGEEVWDSRPHHGPSGGTSNMKNSTHYAKKTLLFNQFMSSKYNLQPHHH